LGLDLLGNSRVGKRAEKGFLDSKDRRCLVKHLDQGRQVCSLAQSCPRGKGQVLRHREHHFLQERKAAVQPEVLAEEVLAEEVLAEEVLAEEVDQEG
jgi:hypothetical protein